MNRGMGCVGAALLSAPALAQDMVVTVEPVGVDRYAVSAAFQGAIPAGSTTVAAVWYASVFRVTGDGSLIDLDEFSLHPEHQGGPFWGPALLDDGPTAEFTGTMIGVGLAISPPAGSAYTLVEFDYAGAIAALDLELFGDNTALFTGDPAHPFGRVLSYTIPNGAAGDLTYEVRVIPAPGVGVVAFIGCIAGLRRRGRESG